MAIPIRQEQQQDVDAIYIRDRINAADKLEADGKQEEQSGIDKQRLALDERVAAGKRLIEVRNRCAGQKDVPHTDFKSWCEQNQIARRTAYDLMALAGDTPEEREEKKAKERERKQEERAKKASHSVEVILNSIYPNHANYSATDKRELKAELCKINPDILKREYEELLRAEALKIFTARHPDHFEAQRPALPEKMEAKVQRAIAIEIAKVKKQFHDAVEAGIREQLAERVAHVQTLQNKAREAEQNYKLRCKGIEAQMSRPDYKFLLQVLHPDRKPEDVTQEKLSKAFNIIRQLDKYIEAANS